MKVIYIGILSFTLCAGSLAQSVAKSQGQQAQDVPHGQTSEGRTAAQRNYDPLAGRQHLRGGIWDNALGKVNPENKDYGAQLDQWRKVVVGETIHNLVFWTAIILGSSLLLSLLFIYWLIGDRARRLEITVNILTQTANAYIDAGDHALDAIERHNQLANDYNAMAEKLAALEHQKEKNQKQVERESGRPTEEGAAATSSVVLPNAPESQAADHARAQLEQQMQQRFTHQISALQEKNKTLRTSLNEALAQIEDLKRRQAAVTGA
jgi:hypothetical protein